MKIQKSIKVRMRDGIHLVTDVVLPDGDGPFAAVLFRSPYNRANYVRGTGCFLEQNIAVVSQDVRGRYESEGEYYPFANEFEDGIDTVEWLKAQPWSNGKIAMYGDSYLAHVQFAMMRPNSVSFTTLNPRFMCGDGYARGYYCGGIFNLALTWSWLCFECASSCSQANLIPFISDLLNVLKTQPVSEIDMASGSLAPIRAFRDFAEHRHDGPFWDCCNLRRQNPTIDYPVLLTGGWYDFYAGETIKNFLYIREHSVSEYIASQHRMIIGPWTHGIGVSTLGEIDFGEDAVKENYHSAKWVIGMLKGMPAEKLFPAPVRFFVMGRNAWRDYGQWPPKGQRECKFFLQPGKALSMDEPEVDEDFESCVFDWENPVPTLGGNHSIGPYNPGLYEYAKPGPFDQRPLEAREDVLSFTTSPLERDTEVIGIVHLTLFGASDTKDADWFAKLIDVHPDGKAYNITEGCLRSSFRKSSERQEYLQPGEICQFNFELGATAMCFKAGHSIRLDVCCSNFPLFELNTAALEAPGRIISQQVYYGKTYPSCLILPIVG